MALFLQRWEESERGWGTRPDGISLHKSEQDCKDYIQEYWDSLPDETPDEYERPTGKVSEVDIQDAEIIDKVNETKNGLRVYRNFDEGSMYQKIATALK